MMKPKYQRESETRIKYSVYLEKADIEWMQTRFTTVGIPIAEYIRRAIATAIERDKKK